MEKHCALGLGAVYFSIPSYVPEIPLGYKVYDGMCVQQTEKVKAAGNKSHCSTNPQIPAGRAS